MQILTSCHQHVKLILIITVRNSWLWPCGNLRLPKKRINWLACFFFYILINIDARYIFLVSLLICSLLYWDQNRKWWLGTPLVLQLKADTELPSSTVGSLHVRRGWGENWSTFRRALSTVQSRAFQRTYVFHLTYTSPYTYTESKSELKLILITHIGQEALEFYLYVLTSHNFPKFFIIHSIKCATSRI